MGCMELLATGADQARPIGLLALVERPGDRAQGKPQRITAYVTDGSEPGQAFKLDPDRALFVISEQGFWTPPDWDSRSCKIRGSGSMRR